jgi:hypothetical protein
VGAGLPRLLDLGQATIAGYLLQLRAERPLKTLKTPVMSTARRHLGTGPSTTRSTPTTETSPRLLPAERFEPAHSWGVEHQDVTADRKGRRNLGPGAVGTPEGVL